MITVTGPALAIVLIVGYLGMNAIAEGIAGLFRKDMEHDKENKK